MTLLDHTPCLEPQRAQQLAGELFNIALDNANEAYLLPSERDQNFRIRSVDGSRYVLKIANALELRKNLESQNATMTLLARKTGFCPQVISNRSGELISEIQGAGGMTHLVRLVTYLEGVPFGTLKRHTAPLFNDLGSAMGRIDHALLDMEPLAVNEDFHWDMANGLKVVEQYVDLIAETGLKAMVRQCAEQYERIAVPLLPGLRRSLIHNDANDYNVIVGGGTDLVSRNQRIKGIIDFGDMVFSYTVADLAVAMAYAVLDQPDPLVAAAQLAAGYHDQLPLTDAEFAVVFHMVRIRLCMSVCLASYQMAQRPDDPYLAISQQPIRNTLPLLVDTHHRLAEALLRNACGLDPAPRATQVVQWLSDNGSKSAPVLELDPGPAGYQVLDLSIASPLLEGDPADISEAPLTRRLFDGMAAAGVKIAVGRYDEPRLIYTSPLFAPSSSSGTNRPEAELRTVHLGMDLFAAENTPVAAPLNGTVHAVTRNDEPLDYGPVVILRHEFDAGNGRLEQFFTLYGHLSTSILTALKPGQTVAAGETFAAIGPPEVNGGWPPHLHFQIITDLHDLDADFPGVVRASQRAIWRCFSPDPNLILNIPAADFPEPEPAKPETLATRRRIIGPSLSISYDDPVKIVRGFGQYLYDDTGRRYLDAYNNVPHVGHCHPEVVAAARRQIGLLNTNTRYLHDNINRFAERLTATLPDPLSVCFFVNTGSEGNELALRLARTYTGRKDIIVLEGAYHGHTTSLIDISPYKHDGPGGHGAPDWVHTAPVADRYRGAYKADDPQAAAKYAAHVEEIVARLKTEDNGPAAFIAESCPSVGGQIFFPDGYLAAVFEYVRGAGGICIADEVQTGYGRTGSHFYAFEAQDVIPDIVVLGKPIGNGHPLSAVITTPEIAAAFNTGMEFFSTFGGNPVSCAVGLSVLEVVQRENLQAHAHAVGQHLLADLQQFRDRYAIVGDVRGAGLFQGIELVKDRETLEPAPEAASFIVNRMREYGILMGTEGPLHNVVKIRPPMPFSLENADRLVETMERVLEADFA